MLDGQPAGYSGRDAFARRLTAAFSLPSAVRQKNSVPSIVCSRLWGSIDGTIGYWVPRQRLEFAVKVAGDVHRPGPWRRGGRELGCAGGAGAATGVRPYRRAGQNEAGEALAGHHMRRALTRHQPKLTEEVTGPHPPHVGHLAVGMLQ